MLGEVLEETATHAPAQIVSILELLLSTRDDPFGRYDLVRHAPGILAAAFNSGDPAAAATACASWTG